MDLIAKRACSPSSELRRLLPQVDAEGVIRVGGRLQNAYLPEDEKHPTIIPKTSHLAELVIRDAHLRTLHGGPQLIQSFICRTFWIVHARNRIRRLTRQCARGTRFQGHNQLQQMVPLPAERITPSRPFAATGLDYFGPFWLRTSKRRGHKAYKGYVAVFVCLATRAIHLEVVSDLSTNTFLLAFRRFISLRGLRRVVFSDNGTTFRGADTEIQSLFNASSNSAKSIINKLATEGIEWRFIPPSAPHFGGL